MNRISRLSLSILLLALALAPLSARGAVKRMFVTSIAGSTKLSLWPEAQGAVGLAAGDEICRTLAEDASLPNFASYRAWLSNATSDAYCRVAGFSGKKSTNCGQVSLPEAGPWQRVDGKPFARSLSQLTEELALLHPPLVNELGGLASAGTTVHSGTEIAASKSELVVASIGAYAIETAIVVDEHGEYSGNLGQASWTGSDNLGERVAENCAGWTSADSADDGRSGLPYSVRSYWTSATPARACNALLRLYCVSNTITIFWDGFESSTTDRWSATVL